VPTAYYGASDGSGLDGEGRYTKVTVSGTGQTPVTSVIYTNSGTAQPIGSLTKVTFGSLDNDNFSYNTTTGRPAQYQFKMGTSPLTDTGVLTWNANGTLGTLAITDQINSAENQSCSYTYDDLGRLASKVPTTANIACGTAWNQTISLDPFGNISKSATVGTSFQATYSSTTNRLTQIGSSVPTYDTNGNLTNDTFHAYTWDAEGKMLSADGSTVAATYDAFGRMVEQTRGSNYTQILYGPGGRKLALMNGQTLQKAFVQLLGGATAVYNSSGLAYYRHSDWLGSSRLETTPTRTKYYDVAYAPYGESYDGSGTTADISFTRQNPDTVSWLYDFMFREYNPVQGRWMSPDPAGLAAVDITSPQTWNRYAYVDNNPLSYIDPDGTSDCYSAGGSYDCGPVDLWWGPGSFYGGVGGSPKCDQDPSCSGTYATFPGGFSLGFSFGPSFGGGGGVWNEGLPPGVVLSPVDPFGIGSTNRCDFGVCAPIGNTLVGVDDVVVIGGVTYGIGVTIYVLNKYGPGAIEALRHIIHAAGSAIDPYNQFLKDLKACTEAYVPGPERDKCYEQASDKFRRATGRGPVN